MTTLQDILALQPKDVSQELAVLTKEDLPAPLLHIAIKPFAYLQPNISRSGMLKENRTIPRVHCGEDLLGCFIGYGFKRSTVDLTDREINKSKFQFGKDIATYRGGYYIHAIDFDYCLKPSKKLVPDVGDSREKWLVTYDAKTIKFPAKLIGLIIIQNFMVESDLHNNDSKGHSLTFIIKANEVIKLRDNVNIGVGHWRLLLNDDYSYELTKIDEQEFLLMKNKHANLLSYDTPLKAW